MGAEVRIRFIIFVRTDMYGCEVNARCQWAISLEKVTMEVDSPRELIGRR